MFVDTQARLESEIYVLTLGIGIGIGDSRSFFYQVHKARWQKEMLAPKAYNPAKDVVCTSHPPISFTSFLMLNPTRHASRAAHLRIY